MRRERSLYEVRLKAPSNEQKKLPASLRTHVLYRMEQVGATKRSTPVSELDSEAKDILMLQFLRKPLHARSITARDLRGMDIDDLLVNIAFIRDLRRQVNEHGGMI